MLNTFRGQFWLQAVFRQKANDFAKRSRPRTDVGKHITIGGRPHVGAPVLQAVEHYHQVPEPGTSYPAAPLPGRIADAIPGPPIAPPKPLAQAGPPPPHPSSPFQPP